MRLFFTLVFALFISVIHAQDVGRYYEKEIEDQGLYIKASQKKLLGKYDEAIKLYGDILEKNPSSAPAIFDLSRIYLEKGDRDNAISYGEKALKKASKNAWYRESLAEIHYEFGNYDQCGKYLTDLIKGDPNNRSLYTAAINAYGKAENDVKLLSTLQSMENAFGPSAYTIKETTKIYLDKGQNTEGLKKAEELLKLNADDLDFLILNAELQQNYGSQSKAAQLYSKILILDPGNSKALVFEARKDKGSGELSSVSRIINSSSVDIDAKIKALIPYANKITPKDPMKDELLNLSQLIVAAHPDEAKGYALYGDMLYYSGDNVNAASNYSEALKLDKSVYAIWDQLMNIQMELNQYDQLAATSQKALDYYPNQGEPYAFNAIALSQQGNHAEAKDMILEAKIIGAKSPNVKTLITIAEAYQNGEELIQLAKEELSMKGIDPTDASVIKPLANGKFLVRVKKGS